MTTIIDLQSYVCEQSTKLNARPENVALIVFILAFLGVSLHCILVTSIYYGILAMT